MGRKSRARDLFRTQQTRSLLTSETSSIADSAADMTSTVDERVTEPAADCSNAEPQDSAQNCGLANSRLADIQSIMGELCHGQFRHFLDFLANTCAITRFLIEKGSPQLYLAAQEFTKEKPELLQYIMEGPNTTIIRRDELSLPPKGMESDSSTHNQPQNTSIDIVAAKETSSQDHPTPSRSEIFAPVTPMPQKSELLDSDSVPATIAATTAPEKEQTTPTVTRSPQNMEGGTQVEKLHSHADMQAEDGYGSGQESPESQKTPFLPIAKTNLKQQPSLGSPCRTNSVSGNELSTSPFSQPYNERVVSPQHTPPQQQSIVNYTMVPDIYGPQNSMVYNMPIQLLTGSMQAGQTLPSFPGQMPPGSTVMSRHAEQGGVDFRLPYNPYHSHVVPSPGLVNASVPSTFFTAAQLPSMAQGSTFHTALPSVSGSLAQHPGGPAYVPNLTGSEGLWETGATGPLGGYIVPSDMC